MAYDPTMGDGAPRAQTTGGGGVPWEPIQGGLDFGMNLYHMMSGNANARKGLDKVQALLAKARQARDAQQRAVAAQYAPYQTLGYGALVPLASLAGESTGTFRAPQSRSLIPGQTVGTGRDGGYTASQPGQGVNMAALFDPQMLASLRHELPDPTPARATPQTVEDWTSPTPGDQTSAGVRNVLDGGRNGDMVLRTPAERAYADQWLADNPGQTFGDADLHGYRNLQTALGLGLTEEQWSALSPADQKILARNRPADLATQQILARLRGGHR